MPKRKDQKRNVPSKAAQNAALSGLAAELHHETVGVPTRPGKLPKEFIGRMAIHGELHDISRRWEAEAARHGLPYASFTPVAVRLLGNTVFAALRQYVWAGRHGSEAMAANPQVRLQTNIRAILQEAKNDPEFNTAAAERELMLYGVDLAEPEYGEARLVGVRLYGEPHTRRGGGDHAVLQREMNYFARHYDPRWVADLPHSSVYVPIGALPPGDAPQAAAQRFTSFCRDDLAARGTFAVPLSSVQIIYGPAILPPAP